MAEEFPDAITSRLEGDRGSKTIVTFVKVPTKGRPMYKLTEDGIKMVEYLASINCTQEEIAAGLRVAPNVLRNRLNKGLFEDALRVGRENFKRSIRQSQARLLKKDNAAMAMFLGQNYLGQSNSNKIEIVDKSVSEMTYEELYERIKKKREGNV